ncbi:SDR family NAD(P)-dependent oxidoreductase [Ferviditalea candida]|uniref:SDR family oxidoreductase n=1 Tax=Ferviditalea candida TaxID=3108399 RepID=A0ABU5ZM95_9BACL|nr:SDR family oxidoreductase [Paenibacillaceae bacterium T2]
MELHKLFDLTGKNAIITGGAGYLGKSISESLSEAGANVFVASRDLEKCTAWASQLSGKTRNYAEGRRLDISDELSIQSCFEDIYARFGTIDILVNNSSFSSPGKVEELTEKAWNDGIDGTLNGVFRCTKYALSYMMAQRKGVILNVASMYGVVSPNPEIYGTTGFDNPANYGAGKAGIIQFTKYVACHYGRFGIRCNAISPGPFPQEDVQKNPWFMEQLSRKTPLGRIGRPDELKGAVVFLSSEASSYITGQNICADGGWTAW